MELATRLTWDVVKRGGRAALFDCDRTITPNGIEESLSADVLIAHPEDAEQIQVAIRSLSRIPRIRLLVINRAGSLAEGFEIVSRYAEKKRLWTGISRSIDRLPPGLPILLLEDARRSESVEYMVHPALYYICDLILDAAEDGKKVQNYRIVKRRMNRTL